MMDNWQQLELKYAKLLKESHPAERRQLFTEAYSAVSALRELTLPKEPEERTAGTSAALASTLIRLCRSHHHILEIGSGRGYTCLKLAPHVASIIGLEVSDPELEESRELLKENRITNVEIRKGFAEELRSYFGENVFDRVISIDVYEHIHPEDAVTHLEEVYAVLKPKGEYIILTPNRLTGPHDMTRDVFPEAKEPLGFHLNEITHRELIEQMRKAGFTRFRSVIPLAFYSPVSLDIVYPAIFSVWIEKHKPKLKENSFIMKCYRVVSNRLFLIARKG